MASKRQQPDDGFQSDPNFQLPPHDPAAERQLLGALLLDSEAIVNVHAVLEPADFFIGQHRKIYQAIVKLFERQEHIDVGTVASELVAMKLPESDGYGYGDLAGLMNDVPTALHAETYAKTIERHASLRRLIEAGGRIASLGYSKTDPTDAIETGSKIWIDATQRKGMAEAEPISVLIEQYVASTEARRAGDLFAGGEGQGTIVPTEIRDLDALLGGQHPGDMIVAAARPGLGKTSLLIKLAINAAQLGCPAGFFSLEMGKGQIVNRAIAAEARVDVHKLRMGTVTDEEWQRALHTAARIKELPWYIDTTPRMTIASLRAAALRMKHRYGIQWLGVDYLGLIRYPESKGRRIDEVSEVSHQLKALALELGIPVVVAAQLNRQSEARKTPPQMSDLKDSGEIEQDADVIILLSAEEADDDDDEPRQAGAQQPVIVVDAHVAKHRNGPVGVAKLRFERPYTRFDDLSERDMR